MFLSQILNSKLKLYFINIKLNNHILINPYILLRLKKPPIFGSNLCLFKYVKYFAIF